MAATRHEEVQQKARDHATRHGHGHTVDANPDAVFRQRREVEFQEVVPGTVWFGTVYGDRTTGSHGTFVRMPPGAATPPHLHDAAYHAVIIEGVVENPTPSTETSPTRLGPGSYYFVPAKAEHVTRCAPDSPSACLFFFLQDAAFNFVPVSGD